MEDICGISYVYGARTFTSFTALLNTFESDDNLMKKQRCEMNEVEDPLKVIDTLHMYAEAICKTI